MNDKAIALAQEIQIDVLDVIQDDGTFQACGSTYLVLDDAEADIRFSQSIRDYIDDDLEIPDKIRPYFDIDAFEDAVLINDGRGPTLASFDGKERKQEVDGQTYYLYRLD